MNFHKNVNTYLMTEILRRREVAKTLVPQVVHLRGLSRSQFIVKVPSELFVTTDAIILDELYRYLNTFSDVSDPIRP